MTTDPLIRPEGVYVGTEGGATRYRPEEASMTDPAPVLIRKHLAAGVPPDDPALRRPYGVGADTIKAIVR